jgi:hypothetical protein
MDSIDIVATLRRWEDAGAYWRVLSRRGNQLTVALYRCDGGEEVERFTSADTDLISFIGDRVDNFD